MRETEEQRINNASSLLDVLLILKHNIFSDLKVATLAYVEEIVQPINEDNSFGIVRCKPFPLNVNQQSYSIYAYYFDKDSNSGTEHEFVIKDNNEEKLFVVHTGLEINDIILVVFCDKNFINNLNATNGTCLTSDDENYHSLKYGVVVKTK